MLEIDRPEITLVTRSTTIKSEYPPVPCSPNTQMCDPRVVCSPRTEGCFPNSPCVPRVPSCSPQFTR